MRAFIFCLIVAASLGAQTLDAIIASALKSSDSVEALHERVLQSREREAVAGNYENPVLSVQVNALHLDNIGDRSAERMQSSALLIRQKIPWGEKRELREKVQKLQSEAAESELAAAQAALVAAIRREAYGIWMLQEVLGLETSYAALIGQNIDLFNTYSALGSSAHLGLMRAQLALSDSQVEQQTLKQQIARAFSRLSYLANRHIDTLALQLAIMPLPPLVQLQQALAKTPRLERLRKERNAAHAGLELARAEQISDPVVQAGYFRRDAFEDYLSVGLSFALPVYGTEKGRSEAARHAVLEREHRLDDAARQLRGGLEEAWLQMREARQNYGVLNEQNLPQLEHMFELAASSIRTGEGLYRYIELLQAKLRLERRTVKEVAAFHIAYAKANEIIGVVQ